MSKKIHKTSIGGQAIIEGVMMRGPKEIAIAVRKPDHEITIDKRPIASALTKYKFLKLPIIRGCVSFFESMVIGVKALMFSAEFFDIEPEENEQPGKFDQWLEHKFGEKLKDYTIYFSVILAMLFAIGLFFLLPGFLVNVFGLQGVAPTAKTLIEGGIRMVIFLAYILLVSRMKDIQRVFQYHGAEHKTIHCYEAGEPPTVENVRTKTRLHPRCGTSFLIIVMIISVFVFMLIPHSASWLGRVGYRLLLLPVVAGLAYEVIKLAGRYDNVVTSVISKPGMWLQYLTTREPDDEQIEVAIASLQAVLTDNPEDDKW